MSKILVACLALTSAALSSAYAAEPAPPARPTIDHARWEAYIRYAEGYLPNVKFEFEDPKPTFAPGLYQLTVHLSVGENRIDRVYYVSADGKGIVNGALWNINEAPFAENLKLLPKEGPSYGPVNAPVTIVLFSDFQCPFCSHLAKTFREDVPKKYGDKVRVLFVDFPLSNIHPWARPAAESAHCIADQRPAAFWAFHDWIFDHQKDITPENFREQLKGFATGQFLDTAKINACLDAHAHASDIDKSVRIGHLLQVQQTPTFFVNGRIESGALPFEQLTPLIDFELNRPKEFAPAAADEKCCEINIPKIGGK